VSLPAITVSHMSILLSALWEHKKMSQQDVATDSSQVTQ